MTPLIFLLPVVILVLILILSRRKKSYSIPSGRKIYGDMLTKGQILRSERFMLSGKPDMIMKSGNNIIPYEYKSGNANEPRTGHMLQMGVYFLLIADLYPTSRTEYGILKYRNATFRIENTRAIREKVLIAVDKIRSSSGIPVRNHNSRIRCFRCPYKDICSQNLTNKYL